MLMLTLVFAFSLVAADEAPAPQPSESYTISVLTFGPGDHPFFKFGHNAIAVRDNLTQRVQVYNYGMFAFDSPLLIPEFLKGRLKYWLATDSMGRTVATYRYENRTINAQELQLTANEASLVAHALEDNAKPENKYYKYDYYLDNCSTRVRDMIDRATKGDVRTAAISPAQMTWRLHTRRLTQDDVLVYLALDLVMADFIDQPIDQWAEMFLPGKLQEGLNRTKRRDGTPLVRTDAVVLKAPGRGPMPTEPPHWHLRFLALGVLLGMCFYLLGEKARRSNVARVALSLTLSPIAGIFGFFGCTFIMFWVATDHRVAHNNENIWLCAPFAIAFFGLARGLWRAHAPRVRLAARIAVAAAAFALFGLTLKALPRSDQLNWEFICFFVPFWLGVAFGLSAYAASVKSETGSSQSAHGAGGSI
jgi:Domain of unknown function (DUF4105)